MGQPIFGMSFEEITRPIEGSGISLSGEEIVNLVKSRRKENLCDLLQCKNKGSKKRPNFSENVYGAWLCDECYKANPAP